jgi:hypothetical protein
MALAVGALFALSACGDDDDPAVVQSDEQTVLLSERVSAADGGTFESGGLKVMIPAGALSADSTITVRSLPNPAGLPDRFEATSDAFEIAFADGATLSEPMKVEIAASAVPTHPAVGGIARRTESGWQPAMGNFFRDSTSTAVALTESAGVFRAVNRSLRRTTGDDVATGREIFMNRTFGNETFFGGTVGLHEVLNNLTPTDAVGAGVQVDLTKVPQSIVDVLTGSDFDAKQQALADPAVTRVLVKADAVIGVRAGYADPQSDMATTAGITCALCHVNAARTEFELSSGQMTSLPIGAPQFDGVPNRTMDAGAILSLTPFAQNAGAATVDLLASWGPGNFDVRALPDNPLEDNVDNPTQIPPLWNFQDLEEQGYAHNWDGLFKSTEAPDDALASQAEAVYDLVMHANGAFGTPSGTIEPELAAAPPASWRAGRRGGRAASRSRTSRRCRASSASSRSPATPRSRSGCSPTSPTPISAPPPAGRCWPATSGAATASASRRWSGIPTCAIRPSCRTAWPPRTISSC